MGSLFNTCLKNIPTFQQETATQLLIKASTITIFLCDAWQCNPLYLYFIR